MDHFAYDTGGHDVEWVIFSFTSISMEFLLKILRKFVWFAISSVDTSKKSVFQWKQIRVKGENIEVDLNKQTT